MHGVMRGAMHLLVVLATVQAGGQLLPAPKSAPKHLTLNTGSSRPSAAPGGTVSLFLDVTPNPGIHVYAPGATDYLPISLTLKPAQGAALVGRTVYPKSETLAFEGEQVPVFQKKFRLAQDVAIARTANKGTMTISGTVKYQACDDTVCFIPATVPVTWTVTIK
jgi:DsbC/DsbD-like thiol-disulfide interchange protein